MDAVVLAEIVRSGFVEGHHYGAIVALNADGSQAWSIGGVDQPIFPRSCIKPLQGVAMVRSGLQLTGEALALACASHGGEAFHLEAVRRVLADAGLDESQLQTPPAWPDDEPAKREAIRRGAEPSALMMTCSGKHAAMLATCVVQGWTTDDYLAPQHPLQRAVAATITELTGVEIGTHGVDGCGAPVFSTTLRGLARGFSRVALGIDGAGGPSLEASSVASAMREHPAYISGSRGEERGLVAAMAGLIAKVGAEGLYAVALPDGRAIALKCDDGALRVRRLLMAAALERWGVLDESWVDRGAALASGRTPVLGGVAGVGEIRASW